MIDLEQQSVIRHSTVLLTTVEIGDFEKYCLLNGLDERIGFGTLQYEADIAAFETR